MDDERAAYVNDPRISCQYGRKCYQKNPAHHNKYKHPPDPKRKKTFLNSQQTKRTKPNDQCVNSQETNKASSSEFENSNREKNEENNARIEDASSDESVHNDEAKISNDVSDSEPEDSPGEHSLPSNSEVDPSVDCEHTTHNNDYARKFIKEKFLVDMPDDFYKFYDFCERLNGNNPLSALMEIGLELVGPFEVLSGKFCGINRSSEEYLIHWRYFHDPPQLQTVLKGDDKTGYHIGYFRDSPDEKPVFLVENHAARDGILEIIGGNIFAAVSLYIEDKKRKMDPFTKLKFEKISKKVNNEAEKLGLELTRNNKSITKRNSKIVTRTLNKIGLVVPYERKSQLGYRKLAMSEKKLETLLTNIQNADPEEKQKLLGVLQSELLTWTDIASDECDFGTGIELGWDIICHGIEDLNHTAARYLSTNFQLLKWDAFAKIAQAHLNNRKKGSRLSIL